MILINEPYLTISIEFIINDMWRGLYWRKANQDLIIYWCIIPCFPIVVKFWGGYRG